MKRILIFICIAIISVSVLIGSYKNNIVFLDKNTLYNYLIQDGDDYYKTFTQKDMDIRNLKNIEEYSGLIQQSVGEFSGGQKKIITECIHKADNFFSQLKFPYFDNEKMKNIDWTIGGFQGNLYEGGLPHTRQNVILIPCDKNVDNIDISGITSTLIHEKVHVYQKLFPEDVKKYFSSKGLHAVGKRNNKDNIRANPDSDSNIYKDTTGKIYTLEYTNNPKDIGDVLPDGKDHPNEEMAYEIDNLFLKK